MMGNNDTTPLSKVDNHIGETVEDIPIVIKQMIADKQEKWKNYFVFKEDQKEVITSLMYQIANWRTQHPDPEMVDRILEYVSENAKTDITEHFGEYPMRREFDVDRDHIKSMRDDILKELSK